jgi:hypothetical protein
MKPSRDELLDLVKKTVVPHTAFQQGHDVLQEAWKVHRPGDVDGVGVFAESRTGKSSLRSLFSENHPKVRTPDGLHAPVLAVRMPTKPTVAGLCERMLRELGDPQADKGTPAALEARSMKLAKDCGVIMCFVEEFHQVFNPTRDNYMYNFGEFMKNFAEESGAFMIPVGLPHAEYAVMRNEQLRARMRSPIRLPRFDWNDEDARVEFIAILEAMQQSIGRYFKLPQIESERIAFLFYCATGGIIGYIAKILDRSVRTAVHKNSFKISMEDLAVAHKASMDQLDFVVRGVSPFDSGFKPKVDDQFMARTKRIGMRPEDAPNAYKLERKPRRTETDVVCV